MKITLRMSILISLAGLIIVNSAIILTVFYIKGSESINDLSESLVNTVSYSVIEKTQNYLNPAVKSGVIGRELTNSNLLHKMGKFKAIQNSKDYIKTLAMIEKMSKNFNQNILDQFQLPHKELKKMLLNKILKMTQITAYFLDLLDIYKQIIMVNYGDFNKDFLMVKEMPDGSISTKYILRFEHKDQKIAVSVWNHKTILYYNYKKTDSKTNKTINFTNNIELSNEAYDPTSRPWFRGAKSNFEYAIKKNIKPKVFWTDAYVFFSDQSPGISCAMPISGKDGEMESVFSVDLGITEISTEYLAKLKISENGRVVILNQKNEILAYTPDLKEKGKSINEKLKTLVRQSIKRDSKTGKTYYNFKLTPVEKIENKEELVFKRAFSQFKTLPKLSRKININKLSEFLNKVSSDEKKKADYLLTYYTKNNDLGYYILNDNVDSKINSSFKSLDISTLTMFGNYSKFNFTFQDIPYIAKFVPFRVRESNENWMVGIVVPEDDFLGTIKANTFFILGVSLVTLLFSILTAIFIASKISKPLGVLVKETDKIREFRLDNPVHIKTKLVEMSRMGDAFNNMVLGLLSFEKYVPSEIVRYLIQSGKEAVLGGENKVLTVYFSDIAGFTSISENLKPEKLVSSLGEYISEMSNIIMNNEGTIDKYIGDAVMAFWGAPKDCADHAYLACKSAIENQDKLKTLRESKWKNENKPLFKARIGLNTGELIVGNMGSDTRMNYTVIGDTVNLASRLEGINKYYDTNIICSEFTYNLVKDRIVTRKLDLVTVKGKADAVGIHEIVGLVGHVETNSQAFIEQYEEGFKHYIRHDFSKSLNLFKESLKMNSEDVATKMFIERCEHYIENPPGADWNGIYVFNKK